MTVDQPSAFTTERSRDTFHAAYDRALERLWPVPVRADDVDTAVRGVHTAFELDAEDEAVVYGGTGR